MEQEKILYKEVSKSLKVKPQECANFLKELNGQKDWCAIRDTKCPMVHGIEFKFHTIPPEQLYLCSVLQELNSTREGQLIKVSKTKNCQKCSKSFSGSRSNHCEFCREAIKRDKARLRKQKERS
ncbi:hypothetical protein [Peribacillus frigoritolerans]|uniref:hypothetical protein n=1 Tax=Peribacillus frigoritolerans TaxID=450367 RepID=UPI00399F78E3